MAVRFSVLLLVIVAIIGEGRGAYRWLDLGVVRFQPSELLKLTMPMMVAWYLHPRHLPPSWKHTLGVAVLIGVPVAPDRRAAGPGHGAAGGRRRCLRPVPVGHALAAHPARCWAWPRWPRRWPGTSCTTTSASAS